MKEEIKQKLKELADEKYRQFHSKLCPGTENILGIRIPVLRNYAKELVKQYPVKKLLEKIGNEYYEEVMLQGMVIGLAKEDLNTILTWIEQFIPQIDNWAVCDTFCAGLKITKKYPSHIWEFIQKYLKSQKEFEIRFAVVMMLDYYITEEYIERDIALLNQIKSDKYYVRMAVAWALSYCFIKFYDRTLVYFQSKTCNLDNFTYNKAIQKALESYRITPEQKDILRKMKRS